MSEIESDSESERNSYKMMYEFHYTIKGSLYIFTILLYLSMLVNLEYKLYSTVSRLIDISFVVDYIAIDV